MARHKVHEEHANHEAWAIPYGDLITLLLAFFVVMYATSSINEGKYRVVSNSLVTAFNGTPQPPLPIAAGSTTAEGGGGAGGGTVLPQDRSAARYVQLPPLLLPITPEHRAQLEAEKVRRDLDAVADDLRLAMAESQSRGEVRIVRSGQRIEMAIGADVLFASGQAELTPAALEILARAATVLASLPYRLQVEGHTDAVPISNAWFPSNWELSAARAGRVIRLFESAEVAAERMTLRAYGEHRPEVPNDSPANRNRNRRVMVIIQANDAAE